MCLHNKLPKLCMYLRIRGNGKRPHIVKYTGKETGRLIVDVLKKKKNTKARIKPEKRKVEIKRVQRV